LTPERAHRVESLDLIRGVAVLGILAINIAGFAGPSPYVLSPHLPSPGTPANEVSFAIKLIFFEGKMRALFCILFGAGVLLFLDREEERGRFAELLQMRRLGWLMVFGLLHYYLLWWGDILFPYAVTGIFILFAKELPTKALFIAALAIFLIWHLTGTIMGWPDVLAEQQVRAGTANLAQLRDYREFQQSVSQHVQEELSAVRGGFLYLATYRMTEWTFRPLVVTLDAMGELLPLMMIGVMLVRTGFFHNAWPKSRLVLLAFGGTAAGLALTLGLVIWAWNSGFPPRMMENMLLYWSALPHALVGLGYAAILVLASSRLARGPAGRSLIATGRMAFSNYITTSLVMTAIFYGWGLGLAGTIGHAEQWLFVLPAWAVMPVLSRMWLSRYRRGPLEWMWRSLVEKRWLPNRRN